MSFSFSSQVITGSETSSFSPELITTIVRFVNSRSGLAMPKILLSKCQNVTFSLAQSFNIRLGTYLKSFELTLQSFSHSRHLRTFVRLQPRLDQNDDHRCRKGTFLRSVHVNNSKKLNQTSRKLTSSNSQTKMANSGVKPPNSATSSPQTPTPLSQPRKTAMWST
jgi:hypothetical protein